MSNIRTQINIYTRNFILKEKLLKCYQIMDNVTFYGRNLFE